MTSISSDPRIYHIPRILRRVEQIANFASAVGKRVSSEAYHLRYVGYPIAFIEMAPGSVLLAQEGGLKVLHQAAEPSDLRALVAVVTPRGVDGGTLPALSSARPRRGMPAGFTYGSSDCSGTWDNLANFDYFTFLAATMDFDFVRAQLQELVTNGVHSLPDRYWTRTATPRQLPAGLALAFRNEHFEVLHQNAAELSGALPVEEVECSSPAKLAIFWRDEHRPWDLRSKLPQGSGETSAVDQQTATDVS